MPPLPPPLNSSDRGCEIPIDNHPLNSFPPVGGTKPRGRKKSGAAAGRSRRVALFRDPNAGVRRR
jgi:hypothetical protein